MPPGRSQQIATCLNLMGDWRDSVRSQRSEKTDAVRVCRKTSGWTLCFDERGRNTWIATKCYCLLTQARQWVTASRQIGMRRRPSAAGRTRPFGSRLLLPSAKPVQIRRMRLSVSRAHALLTFRGTRKDSSHALRIDVERQECQWHSARVSPLVHKTERFVDQRTGCLGLRLTFHGVCARSRDDVIK